MRYSSTIYAIVDIDVVLGIIRQYGTTLVPKETVRTVRRTFKETEGGPNMI